ncbi:putative yippee-like protein Os10g0369500 isoform X3 [Carex rostrata]
MGLLFVQSLPGPKVFMCRCCKVDSASHDAILSKNFSGRYGPAYLISSVVNFTVGPSEDRHLLTGWHIVCDVYCSCCQQLLGWKYEKAYDESQKYKEGRFVLEKARVMKAIRY